MKALLWACMRPTCPQLNAAQTAVYLVYHAKSVTLTPKPCPQALSTFGSDFTLIASLFPGKNRRQIKNKYTKECKVRHMH